MSIIDKYFPTSFALDGGNGSSNGTGGSANIDVTAEVGQTIVVEEVDENGKPTKWKAAEYQPRTHWDEMKEVVPLTTITPFYYEALGAPMGNMADFDIVVGNKYKVTFDGVEYVCEAFMATMDGISAPAFGNAAICGGANTGEPFGIFKVPTDAWSTIIFFDMSQHNVGVEGEVVVKIPERYVPDVVRGYTLYVDFVDSFTDGKYIHKISGQIPKELVFAIAELKPVRIILSGDSMDGEAVRFASYYLPNSTVDSVVSDWIDGKTIELVLSAPATLFGQDANVEVWYNLAE